MDEPVIGGPSGKPGGPPSRPRPTRPGGPPATTGQGIQRTRQEIQRSKVGRPPKSEMDRRHFLRRMFGIGGIAAAGAAGYGIYEATAGRSSTTAADHPAKPSRVTSTSVPTKATTTKTPDGVTIPTSPAIVAENAKIGHAWWITTPQNAGDIEGYGSQVSAVAGDTVTLFVNTKSPQFHVEAYRMGYYQGIGGRLIWQSAQVAGIRQPSPTLIAPTNTIECDWSPSLTVKVDKTWPPGVYVLKLVGTSNEQQYVPLCVRDDASKAAIVIQQSVTTWQAYNRWGGYSLYNGNTGGGLSFTHAGGDYDDRARIVSFDRPYDHDWASGAADLIGNEFPVIYNAEKLGLDVTYWTDVDLHARPQLLMNHKALLSLGHDEYWSYQMRRGASTAVNGGVNLAFLGANACYRQIRFDNSPLGPNRHQICYKSAAEDPLFNVNNALVTVNWPEAPVSQPESLLIGSTYQDIAAMANMAITDASSWVFAGTGLTQGQQLPKVVQGEFDRYQPSSSSPQNLDVVAHSIVPNRGNNYSDVTWYTVAGGGGVFATGNATWIGAMVDSTLIPPNVVPDPIPGVTAPILRIMENIYSVLGTGPASATHPSQGNWTQVYGGTAVPETPAQSNAA